jgi:DNA mismatch repair ATPase MutS
MNLPELLSFYKKRCDHFRSTLDAERKKINLVSNLRLTTALGFLVAAYFAFTNTTLALAALLLLVAFVILVQRHSRMFDQKTHLENLLRINEHEAKSLMGDSTGFANGSEFIDPHHAYTHDLDIFGDGSLFQSVSRCNTIRGKGRMADRLSDALLDHDEILANQTAIKELAHKTEFRQHFQAAGLEIREQQHDHEELLAWLRSPSILFTKGWFRIVLYALPAATLASIIGAFFFPFFKTLAIFLAITQWAILGLYIKRVNVFHEYISRKKTILEKYAHLLHFLQAEEFSSALMQKLSLNAKEADVRVKALASLVSTFNARLNAMTNLVVNSLLMFDLQCVYRLEKWKDENESNLKTWLEVICEAEVLCSFGTFSFNHPSFVYAHIEEDLVIDADALGHPLINENECVSNDLQVDKEQSVVIITGANMAGKSTFLRSMGVNMVLALNGAAVCAKAFRCPVIQMRTGMRTADSLKEHQSYFYAELNRLKAIMDELRSDKPLFILLDEILKGTNSTDKQLGSIALVRQLLLHPCLALIATHDLTLGELENEYPRQIRNFCFEAIIEDDQLSFDYKLKSGMAQKMNATYLMKKMGIIPK